MANGDQPVIDWNKQNFVWEFDPEDFVYHMNITNLINRTMEHMKLMEEDATLHVVIDFLRERGYTVTEPAPQS